MSKRSKITVYTICKNESQFVERWLDSMSEADYIVVLDTGSTDDTYEKLSNDNRVTVVRQEKISPWRFDVARNISIDMCPKDTDIFVCTDLDEILTPGWADKIRNKWESGDYNILWYKYSWSHDEDGNPNNVFWYNKIHSKDFYWKHPVHEEITARDGIEVKMGYIDENDILLHHYPDGNKSRSSYLPLLEMRYKEDSNSIRTGFYLVREYMFHNLYDSAIELGNLILKRKDKMECDDMLLIPNLMKTIGRCHQYQYQYPDAIKMYMMAIETDPTFRDPYLFASETFECMGMLNASQSMKKECEEKGEIKGSWMEDK